MITGKWNELIQVEKKKEYFQKLIDFINLEYEKTLCCPEYANIFNAFKYTSFENIKVVILGQDPYHGKSEAHGLAFSVNNNVKIPPSLRNIFKELEKDLNISRTNKELYDWAEQGVLLLNTILTVELNKPLSHNNKGWEIFTDNVIKYISENKKKVVFILWGASARSKKQLIDSRHVIIESVHPSPLSASRGFFGSKPFSKTNEELKKMKKETIKW